MDPYAIIGIHDESVAGVNQVVARIRMQVNGQAIDEDFVLPKPISIEEQLDQMAQARIVELQNNIPPAESAVVEDPANQLIVEGGSHV